MGALGLDFEVRAAEIDEAAIEAASPRERAIRTAEAKARAVGRTPAEADGRPIVAADTIVVLGERVLGKPADRAEAIAMLEALSGRAHEVITGLAILTPARPIWLDAERTLVTFHALGRGAIEDYVAGGGADDKAGAYGLQEVSGRFIAAVAGDLSNVIGLPLALLRRGLDECLGMEIGAESGLRAVVRRAFPVLESLPEALMRGIPD
jgi:septum formation protein